MSKFIDTLANTDPSKINLDIAKAGRRHELQLIRVRDMLKGWANFKQIYRIDNQLKEALQKTEISLDTFDARVLDLLPYPVIAVEVCIQVQIGDCAGHMLGFLVRKDRNEPHVVMAVSVSNDCVIYCSSSWSGLLRRNDVSPDSGIQLCIACVNYVCAKNADIAGTPKRPKYNLRKGKLELEPTTWDVGFRIGPTLNNTVEEHNKEHQPGDSQRHSPRPHLRRAHWHHYWVGSKDFKKLEIRWIAPTYCRGERDLPIVVHGVG